MSLRGTGQQTGITHAGKGTAWQAPAQLFNQQERSESDVWTGRSVWAGIVCVPSGARQQPGPLQGSEGQLREWTSVDKECRECFPRDHKAAVNRAQRLKEGEAWSSPPTLRVRQPWLPWVLVARLVQPVSHTGTCWDVTAPQNASGRERLCNLKWKHFQRRV
jgi:hypothetical protein